MARVMMCTQLREPAAGACIVAGVAVDTHVVVGARVSSKGQSQLQGPWMPVCTPMVQGLTLGMHPTLEASDMSWASGMLMHTWRG